jgi:hypothetical protein
MIFHGFVPQADRSLSSLSKLSACLPAAINRCWDGLTTAVADSCTRLCLRCQKFHDHDDDDGDVNHGAVVDTLTFSPSDSSSSSFTSVPTTDRLLDDDEDDVDEKDAATEGKEEAMNEQNVLNRRHPYSSSPSSSSSNQHSDDFDDDDDYEQQMSSVVKVDGAGESQSASAYASMMVAHVRVIDAPFAARLPVPYRQFATAIVHLHSMT